MSTRAVNPLQALAFVKASEAVDPDDQVACASVGVGSYADATGERVTMNLKAEDLPVLRPICEGLVSGYVLDQGDSFRYLQHRDLEAAGVGEAELHGQALANLSAAVASELQIQRYGEVYAVLCGGNYEASVMLLDHVWAQVVEQLGVDKIVAAVPARDVMAFCPADSVAGQRGLASVVSRLWPDGEHLISQSLYLRSRAGWQPLAPEGN